MHYDQLFARLALGGDSMCSYYVFHCALVTLHLTWTAWMLSVVAASVQTRARQCCMHTCRFCSIFVWYFFVFL